MVREIDEYFCEIVVNIFIVGVLYYEDRGTTILHGTGYHVERAI
jgi:hypothetical protein